MNNISESVVTNSCAHKKTKRRGKRSEIVNDKQAITGRVGLVNIVKLTEVVCSDTETKRDNLHEKTDHVLRLIRNPNCSDICDKTVPEHQVIKKKLKASKRKLRNRNKEKTHNEGSKAQDDVNVQQLPDVNVIEKKTENSIEDNTRKCEPEDEKSSDNNIKKYKETSVQLINPDQINKPKNSKKPKHKKKKMKSSVADAGTRHKITTDELFAQCDADVKMIMSTGITVL